MNRDYHDFLDDMLEHAMQARAFVGAMIWEEFEADSRTIFAVARTIEIIGEAARRVPEDIRQSIPAIPWRQIIGMRNVLAHKYDGATKFIPALVASLDMALAEAGAPE